MRILHVIAQKPDFTGSGIYLKYLIKEASALGHENWLIAGVSCSDKLDTELNTALKGHSLVEFETEALPFSVVGMSDEMPYESTCYSHMSAEMIESWKHGFETALREASKFNPEYIVIHHLWGLVPLVIKQFAHTPFTVVSHGTEIRQLEQLKTLNQNSTQENSKPNHVFHEFTCEIIQACHHIRDIVALNEVQKNEIVRVYGVAADSVRIVGVGFNPKIFYPKKLSVKEPIQILYAGKISKAKGVVELINAFSSIKEENTELQLIGSADEVTLNRYKESEEISHNRIHFLGALTQEALANKMRQSHIFVLPSYYEGASLVTLEALAAGMHVIVSDLPSIRSWVPEIAVQLGRIHFVGLPNLLNHCEPCEVEIPAFTERLKSAIELKIDRVQLDFNHLPVVEEQRHLVYSQLKALYAWESIFKRIIHSVI